MNCPMIGKLARIISTALMFIKPNLFKEARTRVIKAEEKIREKYSKL